MMKLQHSPCLPLPLLLGAWAVPAAAPASAQAPAVAPLSSAVAEAAAQVPGVQAAPAPVSAEAASVAWEDVLERRGAARLLSRRGEWVEAASEWRGVLLAMRRVERLAAQPERETVASRRSALKREAEQEMKRAQSHLSAFWAVRDVVTPEVDSLNAPPVPQKRPGLFIAPAAASSLASTPSNVSAWPAPATPRVTGSQAGRPRGMAMMIQASALSRAPGRGAVHPAGKTQAEPGPRFVAPPLLLTGGSKPVAEAALFAPGLMAWRTARQNTSQRRAVLRWAQSQWWMRPLVQPGVDSRNPMSLGLVPEQLGQNLGRIVLGSEEPLRSVALLRAPGAFAFTAPGSPDALPARAAGGQGAQVNSVLPETSLPLAAPAPVALTDAPRKPRRSWTMKILLPSASEAARAAEMPIGPQP